MPFRIEARDDPGAVAVTPIGELDLATAGPFHDALADTEAARPDCLMLDLRRLTFMDCCGLRIVLRADARARQADRRIQVLCVPGQVRRLLELTGTDQRLDVVEHLPMTS